MVGSCNYSMCPVGFDGLAKPSGLPFAMRISLLTAIFPLFTGLVWAEPISFNRDVRPILSDKCFHCHGPDEKERKGGLRLDVREAALKGGESGPAFEPGKPDKSELMLRVLSKDRDEVMPPPKMHKDVTAAEAAILRRWIAEGAEYQGHWAFLKVDRPEVPPGAGNPIDRFIEARLKKEGLAFTNEAEKTTLIRRATLDLTGLPPTRKEVAQFLADTSSNAFEKVIDRLLVSPAYGEHMSAQWLDLARYADSHGFQTDSSRTMWPWRDWVIQAFNENMPFDQFTIEQLAGDLLPNATRSQRVATGFHRNHRINGEGGIIDEEWRMENVIDRVETTGLTWMALTFNCCRCHDHKYDPISQKEFYQLSAYFNSVDEVGTIRGASNRSGGNPEPVLPLPNAEQERQLEVLEAAVKAANTRVAEAIRELPKAQLAWEDSMRKGMEKELDAWKPFAAVEASSVGGATLTQEPEGTWLVSGANPGNDTYELSGPVKSGALTGVLLDVLPDVTSPAKSLGRAPNGNFVLTGVEAEIDAPGLSEPLVAEFIRAEADYQQKTWEVAKIIESQASAPAPKGKKRQKGEKTPNNKPGWAVDGNKPEMKVPRKAVFVCKPIQIPENATLTIRLVQGSIHSQHNIARFRLSTTSIAEGLVSLDGAKIPTGIRTALNVDEPKRSAAQKKELSEYFRATGSHGVKKAEAEVAKAKKALENFQTQVPTTMVMRERETPRDAFILKRGEYDKPGDKVGRALPAVLPPLPAGLPNDRLGLARWLMSPEHPLTARVWVNRAWERFFGVGFVKTTENLGSQAEWPSHPALLDWLAAEFMQPTALPAVAGQPPRPWDMKALQKLIFLSRAYRQDTRVSPPLFERDPDNRLLARGPRFRLSAESLRDQALALSGLLVPKLGGPSVRPYMPAGVWDETSVYGDMRNYKPDTGEGLYRRTLYTVWKRTAAPPTMLLFDSPGREICTVKRSRTNTPLQALALLNEVTYVEAARKLAERMMSSGGSTPAERIAWGVQEVTARPAKPAEVAILVKGFESRIARFTQEPERAKSLIAQGQTPPNATLDPVELAAYTASANVLLNMDEVITRE